MTQTRARAARGLPRGIPMLGSGEGGKGVCGAGNARAGDPLRPS